MSRPIDFYFDFASPYAYFLSEALERVAAEHARSVRWRPLILWAVLKQIGMPAPLENPVKKAYLLHDMQRSADFFGCAFRMPSRFPQSAHLPARLFYELQANDAALAKAFARKVFGAYFCADADLSDAGTVAALASELGVDAGVATSALGSARAKQTLQEVVDAAVASGVWGSPYVIVDGEPFFGADRLPQIERILHTLTGNES